MLLLRWSIHHYSQLPKSLYIIILIILDDDEDYNMKIRLSSYTQLNNTAGLAEIKTSEEFSPLSFYVKRKKESENEESEIKKDKNKKLSSSDGK